MPKIVDYPRASYAAAYELSKAVYQMGGTASREVAADKLNRRLSGAFSALVSACIKYGLVRSEGDKLLTTDLFKNIELSYNDEERASFIVQSVLSPPVFKELYDRFQGNKLPGDILDKILIKEYDVHKNKASQVASYFKSALDEAGLLGDDSEIKTHKRNSSKADDSSSELANYSSNDSQPSLMGEKGSEHEHIHIKNAKAHFGQPDLSTSAEKSIMADSKIREEHNNYKVLITGPGLSSEVEVRDEDDLEILDVVLKKLRKAIAGKNKES